jgi:hypothetical protein
MPTPQKKSRAMPAELATTLDRFRAEGEKRVAVDEAAKVYQLGFWPDTQRALPTDFLACALFAGVHQKNTRSLRGEELACINGYRVTFTGKMLTQTHADIVMGALQLMRGLPEGSPVVVRPRNFLRSIGRHTGKTDRDGFRQLIDDIIATAVRITTPDGKVSYSGSVLTRSLDAPNGADTTFLLEVNRDLAKLMLSGFGMVDWEQRKALLQKPLALWLQLFLSKFGKPVKVCELHRLSRSAAPLRSFRRQLKLALLELERVGVGRWHVDDEDVLRASGSGALLPTKGITALEPSARNASAPADTRRISESAKAQFSARHPQHDFSSCFAAWSAWRGSSLAKNPDAAFLGFARKWAKN